MFMKNAAERTVSVDREDGGTPEQNVSASRVLRHHSLLSEASGPFQQPPAGDNKTVRMTQGWMERAGLR